MPGSRDAAPWLIVSGGFHRHGAMDLANLALAEHLIREGREVHLVGHDIDPVLESRRGVHAYRTPRLGTVAAGEIMLDRTARRVARALLARAPRLHAIGNGGNFASDDANWVHSVHHAWPRGRSRASLARRLKRLVEARVFRSREARAFGRARLLIANSARTQEDVLRHFPLDATRVHVIPPGADPVWRPASAEQRRDARLQFGSQGPLVLFLGALGADDNKGFGPLLDAWRELCGDRTWQGTLLVGGRGALLPTWERAARRDGLSERVRFLGFIPDVARALAAADVLVSASRYESYGLAIAEALCRGVPAIVPASAGIAAGLSGAYEGLVVRGVPDGAALAGALRRWASDQARWRAVAADEGSRLRQYTLDDMAAGIVRVVEA
jgi:glycosyltransferase involved in cell wall biosynthesis